MQARPAAGLTLRRDRGHGATVARRLALFDRACPQRDESCLGAEMSVPVALG